MRAHAYVGHTDSYGREVNDRVADSDTHDWAFVTEVAAGGYRSGHATCVGWLTSPGHRAVLLEPEARRLGLGYATSRRGFRTYVVGVLGTLQKEYGGGS